jgi:hypothetical protein
VSLPFFNHNLATALIGVAAFGAAAWLAQHARPSTPALGSAWSRYAFASLIAVDAIAVLLSLREIATSRYSSQPHPAFSNADFGMALVGIAILGAMAWVSLRPALVDESPLLWEQISGGSVIVVNLIAILAGVREIGALWPVTVADPELELQRALAVSAFLMVYGAILLAVGFWRRSAFIRWQALVLLVFTIGKTFLYDMRNLSQGYRFSSFLALGALLMAISFAYQKDWLALRDQRSVEGSVGSNSSSEQGRGQ